jgi:hypothetical protein
MPCLKVSNPAEPGCGGGKVTMEIREGTPYHPPYSAYYGFGRSQPPSIVVQCHRGLSSAGCNRDGASLGCARWVKGGRGLCPEVKVGEKRVAHGPRRYPESLRGRCNRTRA